MKEGQAKAEEKNWFFAEVSAKTGENLRILMRELATLFLKKTTL